MAADAPLLHQFTSEHIGRRCVVRGYESKGVIQFVGRHKRSNKPCIGVELDEGIGEHDGTVDGVEYFKCDAQHGLLVSPSLVCFYTRGAEHERKRLLTIVVKKVQPEDCVFHECSYTAQSVDLAEQSWYEPEWTEEDVETFLDEAPVGAFVIKLHDSKLNTLQLMVQTSAGLKRCAVPIEEYNHMDVYRITGTRHVFEHLFDLVTHATAHTIMLEDAQQGYEARLDFGATRKAARRKTHMQIQALFGSEASLDMDALNEAAGAVGAEDEPHEEPPDVLDFDIVKAGWLRKQGGGVKTAFSRKTWKTRWFVLRHNALKYYSASSKTGAEEALGWIALNSATTVKRTAPKSFDIVTGTRTYHIQAPDEQETDAWTSVLARQLSVLESAGMF
eukprot:m.476517 g.476517  ORF g.476517 m.476517 type:complete len:389 (-) comp20553_c0_seq1:86-1252(-)